VLTILLTAGIARQQRWSILAGAAMVFLFVLMLIGIPILVLQVLMYAGEPSAGVRFLLVDVGVSSGLTLLGLMLAGLIAAILIGMVLLRLFAAAYARQRISDDGIILFALWSLYILIFSMFHLWGAAPRYFILGLAALPMYLAAVRVVHRLRRLRRPNASDTSDASEGAPSLLWLRVFADKVQTPDLFRGNQQALASRWPDDDDRRLGSGRRSITRCADEARTARTSRHVHPARAARRSL
jgi:hypothetical protein